MAAGTSEATLTGLTAGTSYTYSAYSDSSCNNLLATAPSFTTLATLASSSVSATGATLTIAGHTGDWYYKHTNTGATCDGPVSGTSTTVTLSAGTSYTFSAYSDSECTSANLLATASAFTTPHSAPGAPTNLARQHDQLASRLGRALQQGQWRQLGHVHRPVQENQAPAG